VCRPGEEGNIDGTVRVYALKGRDKPSFVVLLSMTMVHFAYGIVLIAIFRREGEVASNSIRTALNPDISRKNQRSHMRHWRPLRRTRSQHASRAIAKPAFSWDIWGSL